MTVTFFFSSATFYHSLSNLDEQMDEHLTEVINLLLPKFYYYYTNQNFTAVNLTTKQSQRHSKQQHEAKRNIRDGTVLVSLIQGGGGGYALEKKG